MDKSTYLEPLDDLARTYEAIPNTRMGMYFKALHLAILNMRYETIAFDRITRTLASHGLCDFRRLTGGTPTDFDLDVIEADPYGREKFGDGDLRILARKTR